MWFIYRIFFCITFYLSAALNNRLTESSKSQYVSSNCTTAPTENCREINGTPECIWKLVYTIPAIITLIFDTGDVCLSIYDVVHLSYLRYRFNVNPINFIFFRCSHTLMSLAVLVQAAREGEEHDYMASTIIVAGTCMNIWSLLFFLQLVPVIGSFASVIQDMFKVSMSLQFHKSNI